MDIINQTHVVRTASKQYIRYHNDIFVTILLSIL